MATASAVVARCVARPLRIAQGPTVGGTCDDSGATTVETLQSGTGRASARAVRADLHHGCAANSRSREQPTSWSSVFSVNTLPRVASSILRMSSRRTPSPLKGGALRGYGGRAKVSIRVLAPAVDSRVEQADMLLCPRVDSDELRGACGRCVQSRGQLRVLVSLQVPRLLVALPGDQKTIATANPPHE
jgi:hypothetical protein